MNPWPTQAQADAYYGNPRGRNGRASRIWEMLNLTSVKPPFKMRFAGADVKQIRIHRKCAASLIRVFDTIWKAAEMRQDKIDEWGVSDFGGSYNFRMMRGSSHLSMHSYGCAIDLAPGRFPMGVATNKFCDAVCTAFSDEGWVNLPKDRMHFQAALVK